MMKTVNSLFGPATQSRIALHLMINQLSVSTMPAAARNQSSIVNEIPAEFYVNTDQHKLAAVIGRLLNAMLIHTRNAAIHVSAKTYGNIMLLHLKGQSKLNNPAFTGSLNEVNLMAQNVGGTVAVTSHRNNITTVALSFTNALLAA